MRLSVYRDVYHPTIALLIGQRSVESARWPIYGQIDSNTNEHFSKREKLDETHSRSGALAHDRQYHGSIRSENYKLLSVSRLFRVISNADCSRLSCFTRSRCEQEQNPTTCQTRGTDYDHVKGITFFES